MTSRKSWMNDSSDEFEKISRKFLMSSGPYGILRRKKSLMWSREAEKILSRNSGLIIPLVSRDKRFFIIKWVQGYPIRRK